MNRDLLPCMFPGCVEPGRNLIIFERGSVYLCPLHTQGLAQRLQEEGAAFLREEENNEPD